jgi:O-antigen ligase
MTFKEWIHWLRELPWSLRWFPLLVVIRPLVDNLYFLKEVSPFISPPYLVGVGTPLLCIGAMLSFKRPVVSPIDRAMGYWSVLLIISALLLLFYDPFSLLSIEFVLKLALPVYLYFFLRIFIRDLRDLHGILQSFLYSAIFIAGLLLYEVLVNPISLQDSRGLMRIQGSFGDVVSYGMYVIFTTIIAGYFFFSRQHVLSFKGRMSLLLTVTGLSLLALLNIHHTATYSIFVMVFGLFFFFNLRTRNRNLGLAMVLAAGLLISYFGAQIIDERITPLIETDLAVYAGEQDSDRLFHGRVGRWRMMLENFSGEPIYIQFLGYPAKLDYVFSYIGIGSHNDFLRILFATGVIGLFAYFLFLMRIFGRMPDLGVPQRFLLQGTLIALLFYSISVTPTFYAPFMYFALTIFAYVALPENKRLLWSDRAY